MNRTILLIAYVAFAAHGAEPIKLDLFQADTGGYQTFRIPGIVVTKKGTILTYCEARKSARSDWGDIDIMLRRSADGGATFDAPRKMVDDKYGGETINNPLAIADPVSGTVRFLFCVDYARCYWMRSDDDGLSFTKPVEITSAFEELRPKYDWKVIATGPGHGLRLKSGRLLVPVWLANGKDAHAHRPSCVSTIYSDDAGKTWHPGEIVLNSSKEIPNPSETAVVELSDGRVMLNVRNESPRRRRVVTVSPTGIDHWSQPRFDETLFDPICMASIVRVGDRLVWSNPAGDGKTGARKDLTIRLSNDQGNTWPVSRLLESGIAAYSDLATTSEGAIFCFYECGGVKEQQYYTRSLRLSKIDLEWVSGK